MHPPTTLTTSERDRSKRGRIQLRRFKLALRGNVCRLPSSPVIYFPADWSLTESLFRPRARRRAIAIRPPRVAIRERNPCLFARFRRLGWYVLFIRVLYYRVAAENNRGPHTYPRPDESIIRPDKAKDLEDTKIPTKRTDAPSSEFCEDRVERTILRPPGLLTACCESHILVGYHFRAYAESRKINEHE